MVVRMFPMLDGRCVKAMQVWRDEMWARFGTKAQRECLVGSMACVDVGISIRGRGRKEGAGERQKIGMWRWGMALTTTCNW